MATTEYIDKNGNVRFRVNVSVKSKLNPTIRVQPQRSGIKTRKEAERVEAELLIEAAKELRDRECAGESWGSVAEQWGKALVSGEVDRPVNEVTAKDYYNTLYDYTKSWWKRPASEIRALDVRLVLEDARKKGLSTARRSNIKSVIGLAFKWGIERGLVKGVDQSPTIGITLGVERERRPEVLSIKQAQLFLQHAKAINHEWYPIWCTALLTGMRSGELYALEWGDVDFENGVINLTKSYTSKLKKVKSTKSGYYRVIPMNADLKNLLLELKAQANGRTHIFPRLTYWTIGHQAKVLRGFLTGMGLPKVKFHDLRATFATMLLRDRIAPAAVMKICGWRDLKTMMRYVRLAGIETTGATDGLKLLPESEVMGWVSEIYASTHKQESGFKLAQTLRC